MSLRSPSAHPKAGLPHAVEVYEVGPRDGLQNESAALSVETKLEFIERLMASGLSVIEATSFVSPKWVPQLGDADDLFPKLPKRANLRFPVLVPNANGLERAVTAGATQIAVFASATESFAKNNLNRSVDEALAMFEPVVQTARSNAMWVRGYVSMCFGDPWEGEVALGQVVGVCRRLVDMGCDQLSVGDTIGVATPGHVHDLLESLASAGIQTGQVAVHFHDTYGQALSNTLAALEAGVATVDASAGGLGGCPYAKSATGNLATEDLVWMLHGLGVQTGIDLDALIGTSEWMAAQLGRPSPSRVVRALASERQQREN
ncbi:MAG TPA: hydroxymethylglutaryl-CoA lyase [Acidimicrobiales bacterium]